MQPHPHLVPPSLPDRYTAATARSRPLSSLPAASAEKHCDFQEFCWQRASVLMSGCKLLARVAGCFCFPVTSPGPASLPRFSPIPGIGLFRAKHFPRVGQLVDGTRTRARACLLSTCASPLSRHASPPFPLLLPSPQKREQLFSISRRRYVGALCVGALSRQRSSWGPSPHPHSHGLAWCPRIFSTSHHPPSCIRAVRAPAPHRSCFWGLAREQTLVEW
jgi:hypothetical protein